MQNATYLEGLQAQKCLKRLFQNIASLEMSKTHTNSKMQRI
jgi:hypothetical protein